MFIFVLHVLHSLRSVLRLICIVLKGLNPEDYPDVWLLTAPTVLGYTFSPASFWFLYKREVADSGTLRLDKILAEVNNTFGEKRSYVFSRLQPQQLGQDVNPSKKSVDAGLISFGINTKDFHVSPFSSRQGSYTLAACDPRLTGRVSVCVTLRTSKGESKLVARWWSCDQAVDAQRPAWREVVGIVTGWAWLGLVTCKFGSLPYAASTGPE